MTTTEDSPLAAQSRLRPLNRQRRFPTVRAIGALVLREMSTTYGRSPLGYLWAIIEPVAGITLLTLIFSLAFRAPPLGKDFAMFYATGMVPYLLYMDVVTKVSVALPFSRGLLAYPSVTLIDAILARFILGVMTQLLVAYIVLSGVRIAFETQTILNLPELALGFFMAAVLGLGFGTLNCYLIGRFASWQRVFAILNRPLFLLSCIFFLYETIPMPYRDWLWYNPLVHVVAQVRKGFYPFYDAVYVTPLYVFGFSLSFAVVGLVLLGRYARDLQNL